MVQTCCLEFILNSFQDGFLTWRGKFGNLTFGTLRDAIYKRSMNTVNVYNSSQVVFNFLSGYCLKTQPVKMDQYLKIASKEVTCFS